MALIGAMIPLTTSGEVGKAMQIPLSPIESLSNKSNTAAIKLAIVYVASNKRINQNKFVALADCESGFRDICIVDTNGKKSCGIFMFQKATFNSYCPDLKWNSYIKDDITCASRIVAQGLVKIHWKNCAAKVLY